MGSRGTSVSKLETSTWFTGPAWLKDNKLWSKQLELKCSRDVSGEYKPFKEDNQEREADEWIELFSRNHF